MLTSFYTRWSLQHADMEIQYTVLQARLVWGMEMEIIIKHILLYLLLFRIGTSCSLTGYRVRVHRLLLQSVWKDVFAIYHN